MNGIKSWMVIVVASVLVLLAAFGFILWKLGIFDFTGDEPTAKIIAATLALIGGLIGSVVTIVGMFLKHTIDQQAEKRLKVESDRNIELKKQEQDRLKLDTAIQAVNLLSTSSGKNSPPTQLAGVLFTLVELGQEVLAINLARRMAEEDSIDIDAQTLDWLIDRGIRAKDKATQYDACSLLATTVSTMLVTEKDGNLESCYTPYCLAEWNPEISDHARIYGLISLIKRTLSRPRSFWSDNAMNSLIANLATQWQGIEEPILKNSIGICLEKLLVVAEIPANIFPATMHGTPVNIHSVKKEVEGLCEQAKADTIQYWTEYLDVAKQIEEWGST